MKEQWKLLENLLNVKVASKVAEIGLILALKQGRSVDGSALSSAALPINLNLMLLFFAYKETISVL